MITENENQNYVQITLNVQVYTKEMYKGFRRFEKDKNKGVCTKQNRSVVRGSNVIMSGFY